MINIDFCSLELLVKSALYCAMLDFDVKVLFLLQNVWAVLLISSTASTLQQWELI